MRTERDTEDKVERDIQKKKTTTDIRRQTNIPQTNTNNEKQ